MCEIVVTAEAWKEKMYNRNLFVAFLLTRWHDGKCRGHVIAKAPKNLGPISLITSSKKGKTLF